MAKRWSSALLLCWLAFIVCGGPYASAREGLSSQSAGQGVGTLHFTTTCGYDVMGRLRLHSLFGGTSVGVFYAALDAAGRTTALTDVITDTGQAPSSSTSYFGYTPDDRPYTATLANSVQDTHYYDPDNRLIRLYGRQNLTGQNVLYDRQNLTGQNVLYDRQNLTGQNVWVRDYNYLYNPQGRTIGITQTGQVGPPSYFSTFWPLDVDALGRLRTVRTNPVSTTWSYDGNGNITQQVGSIPNPFHIPTSTETYAYTATNGMTPVNWLPNELLGTTLTPYGQTPITTSYGYDSSGNVSAMTSTSAMTSLTYNGAGHLTAVSSGPLGASNQTVTIGYNARGLRATLTLAKVGGNGYTESFLYRGNQIGQVVISGTYPFTETFLYRPDGTPLELLFSASGQRTQRYWYVVDGQGSVTGLSDSSGALVNYYAYDIWGARDDGSLTTGGTHEAIPQPLRYRGYWYDGWYDGSDWSTGSYDAHNVPLPWYWLTARSYDPVLERFLQPDPSAQDGVRSYVYCHDVPADCSDPSGLVGVGPGEVQGPLPPGGADVGNGAAAGQSAAWVGVAMQSDLLTNSEVPPFIAEVAPSNGEVPGGAANDATSAEANSSTTATTSNEGNSRLAAAMRCQWPARRALRRFR